MIRETVLNTLKVLLLMSGLMHSLYAVAAYAISADEVVLLPPFCRSLSQQNFEPDAYKIVVKLPKSPPPKSFGHHVHHFCHGMKDIIRANKTLGTREEQGNLQSAIGEFNYVLSATAHDNDRGQYNIILAITSTEKAKVLRRLKMTAESMATFQQAIKYDPKLAQAYAGLSDLFKELGMNDEARKILEQGLRQAPNSKSLKRRLNEL